MPEGRSSLQDHLPGWTDVIKSWSVFSQDTHMLAFLLPFASARLGLDICRVLKELNSVTIQQILSQGLTQEMAMRAVWEPAEFCCRACQRRALRGQLPLVSSHLRYHCPPQKHRGEMKMGFPLTEYVADQGVCSC